MPQGARTEMGDRASSPATGERVVGGAVAPVEDYLRPRAAAAGGRCQFAADREQVRLLAGSGSVPTWPGQEPAGLTWWDVCR
jgi:hypothetical protein